VKDTKVNEFSGSFTDWKLTLWGESIDAKKATLLPMPTDHDDDDHDVELPHVTTTAVDVNHPTTIPGANPTDHPDRPVNAKPTGTDAAEDKEETSATASAIASPSATATPTSDALLWGVPSLGVSKHAQAWIYGSIGVIVVFCAALGAYFYWAKRQRYAKNSMDAYEFEVLDDEEEDHGLNGSGVANGARGGKGKGRRKPRGGELYDAFAGESDEDVFSADEEDTNEKVYRDQYDDLEDEKREAPAAVHGGREDRAKLLGGKEV
jgi:kexin